MSGPSGSIGSATGSGAVLDIDWSSQPRAVWSPLGCFARIATAAARPVTVYFTGVGMDADYDASAPLGQALTGLGHPLSWANELASRQAATYYQDLETLPIVVDRHFEDRSDVHVFSTIPTVPQSPFVDVTTDRARAQAMLPEGGALYETTLWRGALLATPDPAVFLVAGQVGTPIHRVV